MPKLKEISNWQKDRLKKKLAKEEDLKRIRELKIKAGEIVLTDILAIDPTGSLGEREESATGMIVFRSWDDYKILHFKSNNWREHVDCIREVIQKEKIRLVVYEESKFLKGKFMSYHFRHLLFVNAGIELNGWWMKVKVLTNSASNIATHVPEEIVRGLVRKKIKSVTTGRMIYNWTFRGENINVHEKDAIRHLYWHLVKREGEQWPWEEEGTPFE